MMVYEHVLVGITNHDEYSLIYELAEDKENMSTLKKQSTIARMERKRLDEMKKKLHTDDECMSLCDDIIG